MGKNHIDIMQAFAEELTSEQTCQVAAVAMNMAGVDRENVIHFLRSLEADQRTEFVQQVVSIPYSEYED